MNMEEIAARVEIGDLIHGYIVLHDKTTYSFDDDAVAAMIEYITPKIAEDVLVILPTGDQLKGAGQITDRIRWLASNAKKQRNEAKAAADASGQKVALTFVRHHITSTLIEFEDETHATGTVYFVVITDIGLDHSGSFSDKYRKENDQWMLSERKVNLEYIAGNTLFGFLHD